MNLSPSWVERLARHGFEAVHWSTIGAATSNEARYCRSTKQGRVSECCLFAGPGICLSNRRRDCHTGSSFLPWLPVSGLEQGEQGGGTKTRVPMRDTGVDQGVHGGHHLLDDHRGSIFLLVSDLQS